MLPWPLQIQPYDGLVFEHGDASLPPEFHRQQTLCVTTRRIHVLTYDYERILSHSSLRVAEHEAAAIIALPSTFGLDLSEPIGRSDSVGGDIACVHIYKEGALIWRADLIQFPLRQSPAPDVNSRELPFVDFGLTPVGESSAFNPAVDELYKSLLDIADRYERLGAVGSPD
jgi:hypothetical protein